MVLSRPLLAILLAAVGTVGYVSSVSGAAAGWTASDPCAAKDRYEKAVANEKVLNKRVLDRTPKGKTPAGSRAEWLKMLDSLKNNYQYLRRQSLDELMESSQDRLASHKAAEDSWQRDAARFAGEARMLRARIKDLEDSNLTPEGKALVKKLRGELAHAEAAEDNRLNLAATERGKARQEEDNIVRLKERYKAVDLAESLEAWINNSYDQEEWSKADDELDAAKKDFDAGKASKDQSMARAKAEYDQALAQLASANTELQGKPHDANYDERMRNLIAGLTQKLSNAEQILDGLDCFADAKALQQKMRSQRSALTNIKLGTGSTKVPAILTEHPGTSTQTNSSGGVFKLTKKEVGHVPGSDAGRYGTWSGSIGESSFSATYATTSSYIYNASLQANWTVPPDTLKPGDTVELGVVTSGTVTGKDRGSIGLSAGWEVSGSVDVLSNTSAFSGISQSGKEYGAGNGSVKFKVKTGGTITISSYRSGVSWGSGGNFTPCTYTYTFAK
jgi:hypothetical protein